MKLLIICGAVLIGACVAEALLPPFLDCTKKNRKGTTGWWPIVKTRRCCDSTLLPKGCECFDISSKSDFRNSYYSLPKCPDKLRDTKFYLYTRSNRNTPKVIVSNNANSISSSHFKGNKPTKFITHGFTDYGPKDWSIRMKDLLLQEGDMNVVIVNWKEGAKGPNYNRATANVRTVGAMLGQLIHVLKNNHGASLANFHLIGHSLGAHISGTAAKEVRRLNNNQRIGRISGLDPAGPNFEKYSANVRLDKSDATFVDVIHSDAESVVEGGFGTRKSCGDVDFWPNNGKHQPGCPHEFLGIASIVAHGLKIACDHNKVLEFFNYSIKECPYLPPNGDANCKMGYHAKPSCRGNVYLSTSKKC